MHTARRALPVVRIQKRQGRAARLGGAKVNELALFAGAGGGILGGKLLGWRTVCAVEFDRYARSVLMARQNDGCLEPFPIWDDVQTFDGKPWRGIVDVVSGGFPCQDISAAGKGAGITGERSGLWKHMARVIGEVGPRYVLVENSPLLVGRGLAVVLGDLASLGYDVRWGIIGAHHVGAPHRRDRIWIVANAESARAWENNGWFRSWPCGIGGRKATGLQMANADSMRELQPERSIQNEWGRTGNSGEDVANANSTQREGVQRTFGIGAQHANTSLPGWWSIEPQLGRVANGVANRVDRLRAIGNGQVPAVVRLAWDTLANP